MKRFFFIALLFSAFLGLSVTASYAQSKCLPGCDCEGIWEVQKNHADAMRVRDRAYERQIIKRNDSTLGLTCFDQAMRVTSRLGHIFSDNVPVPPLPANTSVFTPPLEYPHWGVENLLADELHTVITPVLGEVLNDFGGSLFGNIIAEAMGTLMDTASGFIGQILDEVGGTVDQITEIMELVDQIASLMDALGVVPPEGVVAAIAIIDGLKATLDGLISGLTTILSTAINFIVGQLWSFLMSGVNDMDCHRIEELWNSAGIGGGIKSIEGTGLELGTPYFDFNTLLSGGPADGGTDFIQEIGNATNSGILSLALTDLTTKLIPGGMPSYPASPPAFPLTATVDDIIGAMAP